MTQTVRETKRVKKAKTSRRKKWTTVCQRNKRAESFPRQPFRLQSPIQTAANSKSRQGTNQAPAEVGVREKEGSRQTLTDHVHDRPGHVRDLSHAPSRVPGRNLRVARAADRNLDHVQDHGPNHIHALDLGPSHGPEVNHAPEVNPGRVLVLDHVRDHGLNHARDLNHVPGLNHVPVLNLVPNPNHVHDLNQRVDPVAVLDLVQVHAVVPVLQLVKNLVLEVIGHALVAQKKATNERRILSINISFYHLFYFIY